MTLEMAPLFGAGDSMDFGDLDMDLQIAQVLPPGGICQYQYDFGTTTELVVRLIGSIELPGQKASIHVLARNDPPEITCAQCGKPATQVCSECVWQGNGWLCEECAAKHECGEEMLLPVVNSPRTGMCGYCGPSQELG